MGANQLVMAKGKHYHAEEGLYQEKAGAIDGVYIGSSSVHAYWQPPLAFNDHGIAVVSYSIDSMPATAVKYMMIEARKTQPDALFIINLNTFKKETATFAEIHKMTDYLHLSQNKFEMINALSQDEGIEPVGRAEFFFPIIRYHSRWSSLTSADYNNRLDGLKMGQMYKKYLEVTFDLSRLYKTSTKPGNLTPAHSDALEDLLAYIEREKVRVLFVTVPQAESITSINRFNKLAEIVKERGYDCLELLNDYQKTGILLDEDFQNRIHTNVHGAVKYTEYLSRYLIDTYGFADKRGKEGWESWDAAAKKYAGVISPYTLPFEREHAPRNYALAAPKLSDATVKASAIRLNWSASPGAQGYEIYCKTSKKDKGYWTLLATVDGNTHAYTDENLVSDATYTYTVVPYQVSGKTKTYGRFSTAGVSAKTAAK